MKISEIIVKKLIIVAGHYGSGKTNVAVNLAIALREESFPVTLVDLDTVNPYFRAADSVSMLGGLGIDTIVPEFANTNVDIPSLPSEINSIFDALRDGRDKERYYIFDVGGDDGAAALGMYRDRIEEAGYEMICVINRFRPLISEVEDAVSDMRDIERFSGLRVTSAVNNSSVGEETVTDDVLSSVPYAGRFSESTGIPLLFTSYIPSDRIDLHEYQGFFKMKNITKKLY
ncbi:MAG: hypothetical protein J5933_06770 [Clostridia bacterium]|nr:hypothetical protein [Clostridia bacterium]